jgi:hypothetical protein
MNLKIISIMVCTLILSSTLPAFAMPNVNVNNDEKTSSTNSGGAYPDLEIRIEYEVWEDFGIYFFRIDKHIFNYGESAAYIKAGENLYYSESHDIRLNSYYEKAQNDIILEPGFEPCYTDIGKTFNNYFIRVFGATVKVTVDPSNVVDEGPNGEGNNDCVVTFLKSKTSSKFAPRTNPLFDRLVRAFPILQRFLDQLEK